MIVTVEVPAPLAASVTLAGETAHVGGTDVVGVMAQVSATEPTNPLVEARVMTSVLPVVAPGARVRAVGRGVSVNEAAGGAATVTTIVDEVMTVVPLVPVTVTLREPLVLAVVLIVSTLVPVPPELSVADVGAREQVPVAVPLAFATEQVRATAPAKAFLEARVMVSVLPVVAPAAREMAVVAGVTVNVGTALTTSETADAVEVA